MDLKDQIIQEYLTQGCGFRKLAAKYGISRTKKQFCGFVKNIHGSNGAGAFCRSKWDSDVSTGCGFLFKRTYCMSRDSY